MKKIKREILWEIKDVFGRKIVLTKSAYNHIKKRHPSEVIIIETVKEAIKYPDKIYQDIIPTQKTWYYFKEIEEEKKDLLEIGKRYIMIVVKEREKIFQIATWFSVKESKKKGAKEIWKKGKKRRK